ncbi:hypothetical protein [Microbacterium aurantiacum]|uniref:hypothetical protein n=2 Tax=Microbacterium aurantiacum TaxID=162393 RepID=UPI004037420B
MPMRGEGLVYENEDDVDQLDLDDDLREEIEDWFEERVAVRREFARIDAQLRRAREKLTGALAEAYAAAQQQSIMLGPVAPMTRDRPFHAMARRLARAMNEEVCVVLAMMCDAHVAVTRATRV